MPASCLFGKNTPKAEEPPAGRRAGVAGAPWLGISLIESSYPSSVADFDYTTNGTKDGWGRCARFRVFSTSVWLAASFIFLKFGGVEHGTGVECSHNPMALAIKLMTIAVTNKEDL
jgi:hypothetical protein